jgi:hypothetical protein
LKTIKFAFLCILKKMLQLWKNPWINLSIFLNNNIANYFCIWLDPTWRFCQFKTPKNQNSKIRFSLRTLPKNNTDSLENIPCSMKFIEKWPIFETFRPFRTYRYKKVSRIRKKTFTIDKTIRTFFEKCVFKQFFKFLKFWNSQKHLDL